ncbi:hypothetical protein BO78DRAFT_393716 [Aspergillus sclerotiicarbonarius CBS 121057]|uniref:Uncharacterized protein n=1 Tax=Aspergillus sclerotiicarbonarius (strain CBS 121057 / IBT 28362) TaxID=1448318 RepID=A0A319EKE1_ASPSB|nr:hypothetical protein BO78DRAFT_393716 [Aspergillus sclerotiicarbonarius CBS 121057]
MREISLPRGINYYLGVIRFLITGEGGSRRKCAGNVPKSEADQTEGLRSRDVIEPVESLAC